jgi:hypothetical protein
MDLDQLLVLLHILATGGLFAGLGIEVTALHRIQRAATAAEARVWLPSLQRPGGMLLHLSMIVLLLTGLGLATLRGGLTAWMTAALVAIAVMIVLAAAFASSPVTALATSLEGDGSGGDWSHQARDPKLHLSTWLRVGLYLAVLGLMALKPGTVGSVATLLAGCVLGAAAAAALRVRQPVPAASVRGPAE